MFFLRLSVLLLTLFQGLHSAELPSFMQVCQRTNPDIDTCMVTAVESLKPYLAKGVPEYNIPSMEPLLLNNIYVENTAGINITGTNIKAYGASNFKLSNAKFTLNDPVIKFEMDVFLEQLQILADYVINGKLVMIPIRGNGPLEANITNAVSKTVLDGQIFEKDGAKYIKFTALLSKVILKQGKVFLGNLFGGEKHLSDMLNDAINKNFASLMKELMPAIEKSLSKTFLDIGNKIVEPFTYDQLLPA